MKSRSTFFHSLPYIIALLIVIGATWLVDNTERNQAKTRLTETLIEVSKTTQASLRVWSRQQAATAQRLANLPAIQNASKVTKKHLLDGTLGASNPIHKVLRSEIGFTVSSLGYLGFFLIAPSGESLSSMRDANIGSINLITQNAADKFRSAMTGESLVTAPMRSDVGIINTVGILSDETATMFSLAPIKDKDGNVTAVLALRINPYLEFSAIFAQGRTGLSGETYGFNREGILISESRFNDYLTSIGLLSPGKASTLNIKIRDPGRSLLQAPITTSDTAWPLTLMASEATNSRNGTSLVPYRDYRGIPVVGTWLWDDVLGLGIATEIDGAEAFAVVDSNTITICIFALAIAILIITLGVYQERARRRALAQELALVEAKETAENANHAKMEFLASMSHDLRTPLNAVLGFSQLLALDKSISSNPKQKEQLGYIERSGEHLLTMLNEILEFATVDIGEVTYDYCAVSIADLAEDCCAMVAKDAAAKSISVHVASDLGQLPQIWSDKTRARQILGNILSNAVKYNRPGGEVFLRAFEVDGHLRLEIEDTGHGIAEEKLADLWKPFNRLGAEKTMVQGTGIGLAFSKALVEGLSGKIGASSTQGKGSLFWFSFPIAEEQQRPAPEVLAQETKNEVDDPTKILENKHILYVEDVDINQLIVKRMLKHIDGLVLVCADTGEAGLKALQEGYFDVLLIDIQLPDMDGLEWNSRRKEMGLAPDAPVIAVTADITAETRQRAEEAGLYGYIEKPVRLDTLHQILADAVKKP